MYSSSSAHSWAGPGECTCSSTAAAGGTACTLWTLFSLTHLMLCPQLGLYEGYKAYYFSVYLQDLTAAQRGMNESMPVSERVVAYESPLDSRSPMGVIWWLAILINIFSICGLAGVLNAHRELVIAFFAFNATQVGCGAANRRG